MAAALQAAWLGVPVTLFERNATIGRKLLVTGSGRCNLTNAGVRPERYACASTDWMRDCLAAFGVEDLLNLMHEIGAPVYQTSDGWFYPLSNSAATIADLFYEALDQAGVQFEFSSVVQDIQPAAEGFDLTWQKDGEDRQGRFSRVVVSAGGMAYPALGSRGELFPVLAALGLPVNPKRPALAPVLADLGDLRSLQGVRLNAETTLWEKTTQLGTAAGSLIITEWGLNGPAVMDLSHLISARPQARLHLSLNLLHSREELFAELWTEKKDTSLRMQVFLEAFFPPKAASYFLKRAGLPAEIRALEMSPEMLSRLTGVLNQIDLPVKGVRGFEYCQVSAGGVPVTEVDPATLEARRVGGLYLVGETLDCTGPCGGYNLQFAFGSGSLAGIAAGKKFSINSI